MPFVSDILPYTRNDNGYPYKIYWRSNGNLTTAMSTFFFPFFLEGKGVHYIRVDAPMLILMHNVNIGVLIRIEACGWTWLWQSRRRADTILSESTFLRRWIRSQEKYLPVWNGCEHPPRGDRKFSTKGTKKGDGITQWRNEPKHLGGTIFARERSDQARGSVATERGWVWEGGVPPPTVGSFFIFRLENVQSGAYLRRKFRLDDMYYNYG